MTIDVDGIKRLLRSNRAQYEGYLKETNIKILQAEEDLEYQNEYKKKLDFYLDKSTKILEIVEMAERNHKYFSTIHPRLYETNEYADKAE